MHENWPKFKTQISSENQFNAYDFWSRPKKPLKCHLQRNTRRKSEGFAIHSHRVWQQLGWDFYTDWWPKHFSCNHYTTMLLIMQIFLFKLNTITSKQTTFALLSNKLSTSIALFEVIWCLHNQSRNCEVKDLKLEKWKRMDKTYEQATKIQSYFFSNVISKSLKNLEYYL